MGILTQRMIIIGIILNMVMGLIVTSYNEPLVLTSAIVLPIENDLDVIGESTDSAMNLKDATNTNNAWNDNTIVWQAGSLLKNIVILFFKGMVSFLFTTQAETSLELLIIYMVKYFLLLFNGLIALDFIQMVILRIKGS